VSAPAAPSTSAKATEQKPTVIITGASSGLGLNAAAALAKSGDWWASANSARLAARLTQAHNA
jgi:NAD(P)-dependent dehydrogenase (short-subunit alcohol dehydrogenase family)